MAEVFISYSRHDGEFVHRIHDALIAQGRDVWVDFDDIPPSAEWMNEIEAAIEAAETVIFIISPQSASSKTCSAELSHALAFNKRLVPILRENVDQVLLLKPICDRNWIFCREHDDFEASVASLITAIDTDLDWVRKHTRLLTRAIEWSSGGHDKSLALRGSDLRGAERCLIMAEKEPRLSTLQIEYILASRREENNRRNRLIGVSGLATAVLMVIATLFVLKYIESQHNLARDFREKAMSALANSDPVRAELYLARSLNLDDTPEARQSLLQARAKSARLLSVFRGDSGSAVVATTADGATFAMKGRNFVSLWDLKSGRETARFPYDEEKMTAAFSRDGRFLAVAGEHSISIRPVSANSTSEIAEFPDAPGITSLAFDPAGRVLVSGANDGTLSLWDVQTGNPQPIFHVRRHHHQISSTAFSSDGRFLVSGSWDNDVKLWSVTTISQQTALKEMFTFEGHDDAVLSLAFSPDGTLIASGGWDNRILLWDRASGRQLRELSGHSGGVLSLAFSAQGDWLASGSEDRSARVWQVETGRPLLQLPGPEGNVSAVVFTAPQAPHQVAVGDTTGTIRVWDLDAIGQRDELTTLYGHTRPVKTLAFNPKRAQLASGSWDRTVRLWNLDDKAVRLLGTQDDPGPADSVTAVNFDADGNRLVVASKDGTVRLWNIDTPSVRILKPNSDTDLPVVRDVAFAPDGKLVASGSDDGRVRIWSAVDGSLVTSFAVNPDAKSPASVLAVAFSPDGRLLATSGEDTIIRLWRAADWSLVDALVGHTDEIWQLVFSHDGSLLLSASDDHTARIWDVESRKQTGAPLEHTGPVWGVDIAGDGHMVVTASSDGSVHLWTLEHLGAAVTTTEQTVLRFSNDPVWVIALNRESDSSLLAIGGVDRTVRVVRVNRLNTLFDDRQKLEQDAELGSGLEIFNSKDSALVPYQPGTQ